MSDQVSGDAGQTLPAAPCSAQLWACPVCWHTMTEDQSKGYSGCPTGMHFAQHIMVEEQPCPNCYGGHFRPCQWCGDTGRVVNVPNGAGEQPPPTTKTL